MTLRFSCLVSTLLLFITSVSFAQDCKTYISIAANNSGERMYSFRTPIKLLNKQGYLLVDIDGFMVDSTLVILMDIKRGAPCINREDDIVIKFIDGTSIKSKSAYPANCEYKAALALSENPMASGGLEYFKSKKVSSIEIQTNHNEKNLDDPDKKLVTIDFPELIASTFQDKIKCLSDYFGKKPPEIVNVDTLSDGEKIYTVVDQAPEYSGGLNALMLHIQRNMRYPSSARRMGIDGTVYVSFVIGSEGAIHNIKVVRGISGDCDAEAMRVVTLMPPWTPGRQNGEPVAVRFVLPIKFKLGK